MWDVNEGEARVLFRLLLWEVRPLGAQELFRPDSVSPYYLPFMTSRIRSQ